MKTTQHSCSPLLTHEALSKAEHEEGGDVKRLVVEGGVVVFGQFLYVRVSEKRKKTHTVKAWAKLFLTGSGNLIG